MIILFLILGIVIQFLIIIKIVKEISIIKKYIEMNNIH